VPGNGRLVGYGVIGSTTDSGSVSLGSSPGTPANAVITFSRPVVKHRGRPPGAPTPILIQSPRQQVHQRENHDRHPAGPVQPSAITRAQSSTRNPGSGAHRAQNRRRQPHQLGPEQMTTLRSSAPGRGAASIAAVLFGLPGILRRPAGGGRRREGTAMLDNGRGDPAVAPGLLSSTHTTRPAWPPMRRLGR
jgi:hypothetical protein